MTLTEKKEDKKKRDKEDNKENKNSVRADRKRKHSPARSTGRSITPVPESRIIVIKPENRIAAPPNNSYVPTLTPPSCIPNIISPINSVPNSPEAVQLKSLSIATFCLDEPFQPTIVADIVNNRDDFNHIVKSTEVKAQSSASARSINEEDTYISLFATDEYVPALNSDEIREEVTYEPTPKHILQLKTMAECQNHVSFGMSVVPGLKHVFQLYKATRHLSYHTWS